MARDSFRDAFKSSSPRVNLQEFSKDKPFGRVTTISHLQSVLVDTVERVLREQSVAFDPAEVREQARAQLVRALS